MLIELVRPIDIQAFPSSIRWGKVDGMWGDSFALID
jgi:hypothetical protein